MDDFRYDQLVQEINEQLAELEALPDSALKERIFQLLQNLDLLHREALERILKLVGTRSSTVTALMKKDFVIQTLLMLYGYVPPEAIPNPSVNDGTFIPVEAIKMGNPRQPRQPVWVPAGRIQEIPAGTVKAKKIEGIDILLCRVKEAVYAIQNLCLDSVLPLQMGKLGGYLLTCPWHGCQYDVRTGEIQNGSGLKLETYPVQINEQGRIVVGFNIPEHVRATLPGAGK